MNILHISKFTINHNAVIYLTPLVFNGDKYCLVKNLQLISTIYMYILVRQFQHFKTSMTQVAFLHNKRERELR